jgi:pimeloyl-ACP methyl ester carboxylesterase
MPRLELAKYTVGDAEVATCVAGNPEKPAILLIHGFPSSSATFRNVVKSLAEDCFVVAPDLPGFGASPPVARPSFGRFADIIGGLLMRIGVRTFHLYLHDYGAAVGLHLATRVPGVIRSLIVQNANAHESGLGAQWSATRSYWDDPTPERAAEATAHLTLEGTRDQYIDGIPPDIAGRMDPQVWEDDWRVMSLPGRLETQRALVLDYRTHVARFNEIADYLRREQPHALMLWGRHDVFFELDETLSWMKALPRMEAHILDGPHFLLETHAAECAARMRAFLRHSEQ